MTPQQKARFFVVALGIALAWGSAAPPALAHTPAEAHCIQCGGVVETGQPIYGQSRQSGMLLGGSEQFCVFTSKTDGSKIYAAVETLYTQRPTLAASAYLFKPPYTPPTNPNLIPAVAYCEELKGTATYNGGPGGWVLEGESSPKNMCIFPDLSIIDAWGLLYHTQGTIRGADLTECLRFKPKHEEEKRLFAE